MVSIILRTFSLWVAMTFLVCVSSAQTRRHLTQEQVDSIVNPPLMERASAILVFDKQVVNIGTLTEDDSPVKVEFAFTNVSGGMVTIDRVVTNCGCAVVHFPQHILKPGEKGVVPVVYTPRNHPGTIDASAFVYIDGHESRPVARLTLLGTVLPGGDAWRGFPYSMGALRLKRRNVAFNELRKGQMPSERVLCGNSGTEPVKLEALVIPSFASLRTEPEVIGPGAEADIVITIDEAKIPDVKGKEFSFPIILGNMEGKPADRMITVKVERIE